MSTVIQNVNLYLPEFRRKKHWLDAQKMLLIAGASVGVLVLVTIIEFWQLVQLRGEQAAAEQELQQTLAATEDLIDQYGVQTEDPALLANIRELEADLQSKQALLQFLEGRELGNAEGFSEYLADLSRYHVQGLSLTEISLSEGGRTVRLAGQVVKAELVPIYLQSLSEGKSYAGTNFETLEIDAPRAEFGRRDDAEVQLPAWNFEVRSLSRLEERAGR